MARTIVAIPQFYTDGIADLGAVRDISFHFQAKFDDDSLEWHYYGTEVPDPPPAGIVVEHPVVHFPADFLNLTTTDSTLLYDLGLLVARNLLQL